MQRRILCYHCKRTIHDADDLVTALLVFSVVPFHGSCYSKVLRGWETLVVANKPINGWSGNLMAGVSAVLALVSLLGNVQGGTLLFFLLLIPLGIRLYSWFSYEKPLQQ